jgi:hypothetical protein
MAHLHEVLAQPARTGCATHDDEIRHQLEILQSRMEAADERLQNMAAANRLRLQELWEFIHANSYLLNLHQGLIRLHREVVEATDHSNKIDAVNYWCAAVQADPVDYGRLAGVLHREADDLSEEEIGQQLEQLTTPIAKSSRNIEKKVEEKQAGLHRLLERILSPDVKDRLFGAD